MKKILISLGAMLMAQTAFADCAANLGVNFPYNQTNALCTNFGSAAGQSVIPSADNTYDLGSTSFSWRTIYLGTSRISKTSDILEVRQDVNRLFTWDASSDTALTMTFGDGGTTAVQQLTISASTADGDDDSSLILAGGGAAGATRGATITLPGEEVAGGSDITYNAGTGDTHIFQINGTTEVTIADDSIAFTGASGAINGGATSLPLKVNGTAILTLAASNNGATFTGPIVSTSTTDIGWSIQSAANQACNTTCVNGCVFGQETTSKAILACTDATADVCLCAGAS